MAPLRRRRRRVALEENVVSRRNRCRRLCGSGGVAAVVRPVPEAAEYRSLPYLGQGVVLPVMKISSEMISERRKDEWVMVKKF